MAIFHSYVKLPEGTPGPATSSPNPNMSNRYIRQNIPSSTDQSVDQSKSGYKHQELILNVYIYIVIVYVCDYTITIVWVYMDLW